VHCISNAQAAAPKAQSLIAPRLSVGKQNSENSLPSPIGTAQGHFFCRNQSPMRAFHLSPEPYRIQTLLPSLPCQSWIIATADHPSRLKNVISPIVSKPDSEQENAPEGRRLFGGSCTNYKNKIKRGASSRRWRSVACDYWQSLH
jgi:hypothetical protein